LHMTKISQTRPRFASSRMTSPTTTAGLGSQEIESMRDELAASQFGRRLTCYRQDQRPREICELRFDRKGRVESEHNSPRRLPPRERLRTTVVPGQVSKDS